MLIQVVGRFQFQYKTETPGSLLGIKKGWFSTSRDCLYSLSLPPSLEPKMASQVFLMLQISQTSLSDSLHLFLKKIEKCRGWKWVPKHTVYSWLNLSGLGYQDNCQLTERFLEALLLFQKTASHKTQNCLRIDWNSMIVHLEHSAPFLHCLPSIISLMTQ